MLETIPLTFGSWIAKLFSMEGRLRRAGYFWSMLAISAFVIVGAAIADIAEASAEESVFLPVVGAVFFLLMLVCYGVVVAFLIVKRFHDLDRPGTHFWRVLIPIYGHFLLLLLLFKKGTEGPNRFGPDPDAAATLSLSV